MKCQALFSMQSKKNVIICGLLISFSDCIGLMSHPEQQIILGAFWYLTPSKFNPLGKIIFSFFGLSKDTPHNEN